MKSIIIYCIPFPNTGSRYEGDNLTIKTHCVKRILTLTCHCSWVYVHYDNVTDVNIAVNTTFTFPRHLVKYFGLIEQISSRN